MSLGFSSQPHQLFEWKQPLVIDLDATPTISQQQQQQQHVSKREEVVKEKIILSQEKNIQRLNELVRSLREQLQQCKGSNEANGTARPLTAHVIGLERQQLLEG
uniref:Uncharacterized protein n=1 Tax=Cannabis sativa TaxID=3483 RepID=A0A803R3B9_CANSA